MYNMMIDIILMHTCHTCSIHLLLGVKNEEG